ncbi:MAG TPA: GNAT family N-acetyltransferase [Myxococcota bacterium]|nr:GNAT family N-acetyltransferase [Myxococcota bacterium]
MIQIREADLSREDDARALVEIVDSYARGPGGQNAPLSAAARARLPQGLRAHPAAFALLAFDGGRPVGVAVCFVGFSTFHGQPLVNIHDLAVLPDHRARGIGSRLLEAVEQRARTLGACRVTLEVGDSNHRARRLYERHGFGGSQQFLKKPL